MSPPGPDSRLAPAARESGSRVPVWVLAIFCTGAAVYAMLFVSAITTTDSEVLQALTIIPILLALTVPIALRIARTDGDPTLASIVMAGAVLKFLGALARHRVAYKVYGSNDSIGYDLAGRLLAPEFRSLNFTTNVGNEFQTQIVSPFSGTGFIKTFTGVVYTIFGASTVGGFVVFAWLGFLGLLLFARAFRIGVPEGDSRRYLIVVLVLPGLVYWPSAIGKEAWMMLAIGLAAYGVACVFQKRPVGVVALAAGLGAVLLVRPHIALIAFVGLVFALLVRRAPARTFAAPFFRVIGLTVLLVLGLFLAGQTASFLGEPSLTVDSVNVQLSNTETQTGDGGSEFTPIRVNNPVAMVPAFFTVFFRPLPFEVSSVQELATAGEGILLLGLLFASRRRIRSIPRLMRTRPYVAFSVGYLLAFVFAFSSFANFGILARQRVQAIPFLLVAIALPKFSELVASGAAPPETQPIPAPVQPELPTPSPSRRSRRPVRPPRDRIAVSSGASFPPPPRAKT